MMNGTCHACQAEDAYQQFYWRGNEYIEDTLQCKFCKHIFRNYKGDIEEYHREKYREAGEEGHAMYPKEERLGYISTLLGCVNEYLDKDMIALEVGSGDGLFATQTKVHVQNVICSDIDEKMVKKCQDLGFESITLNVLELKDNQKFDVIFGFDVLEHILDIQAFKDKMVKVVNKLLILQVPIDRTMVPPNSYNRGVGSESFDGHSHYFSPESMISLFEEYFEPKKIFYGRRGKLARGPELLCIFERKSDANL